MADENHWYYSSFVIHFETTREIDRLSRKTEKQVEINLKDHVKNFFLTINSTMLDVVQLKRNANMPIEETSSRT